MSKILFIIPPKRGWDGKLIAQVFPYLGVASMSGYVKQFGHETCALDLSHDWGNRGADINASIRKHDPDIIGLTVFSSLAQECRELVEMVRINFTKPIVLGGPHISVCPEYVAEVGADCGVQMDGEIALAEIMKRVDDNLPVRGIWSLPPPAKLDYLTKPDYSIFELDKYRHWTDKCYSLITSRGCPYGCTYCAAPLVTGRKFRPRPAKSVVDEMAYYAGQGFTHFGICDDAFNADIDRAKDICRGLIALDLGITWDMGNGIRADNIDEELAILLRAAGCNFISAGLETGNAQMLKRIRKGLTMESVVRGVGFANKHNIGTAVNFIIGHPGETWDSAMDTLMYAKQFDSSYVQINGLIPMPGTKAYDELRAEERAGRARFLYEPDYYLSRFMGQNIEPVFETDELSAAQRKQLLIMGRYITRKSAMQYRLGKVIGTLLSWLTLNERVFQAVNNIKHNRIGIKIYQWIRHVS